MSARLECWSFNGQQHCGRFPCCFWKQFFKFRGASWGGFVCFVLPLASSDSNGGPARPLSLQGRAEPQWRPARSAEEESGAEVVDFVWRCGCCCRRRRRRRTTKGAPARCALPCLHLLLARTHRSAAHAGRSSRVRAQSAGPPEGRARAAECCEHATVTVVQNQSPPPTSRPASFRRAKVREPSEGAQGRAKRRQQPDLSRVQAQL